MKRWIIAALVSTVMPATASADDKSSWFHIATSDPFAAPGETAKPNGILVFGGAYTAETAGGSWPWASPDYTDDYFIGGAYTRDVFDLPLGFALGGEVGASLRFGNTDASGEIWSGGRLSHAGIVLGNLNIAPAVTLGLSAVSDTLPIEEEREELYDGTATLLGYIGAELSFRVKTMPNVELVYRLHHRSGGDGFFGDMHEGSNANALGVRIRF